MLIRIGYDIALRLFSPTAVFYVLWVHPSRKGDLLKPENFRTEPELPAHLAITLCRCMNIPARYATGYLGDIGVSPRP
jgi:hypothetical protein